MNLYLIRHGQPEVEAYSGFPGPKLSLQGHKQSLAISNILADKKIRCVYSSDYTRAIETANPFLANHPNVEFIKVSELREREKETENHKKFAHRIEKWFSHNLSTLTERNTAIYGHCGTINVILFHLDMQHTKMKYPFEDEFRCYTPMGGIWELRFDDNNFKEGELLHRGQI